MAKSRRNKRKFISLLAVIICLSITSLVFGGGKISDFLSSVTRTSDIGFDKSSDFVRFIDVGQGDCALIYSNGRSALIDTGTVIYANDVCQTLSKMGITEIDALMLSHLHSDHTGGVERIIEDFPIKNLILPELSTFSEGMASAQLAINSVTKLGGGVYNAIQGMNFNVGEFEVTVLAAYGEEDNENNRSIFAMAEMDGVKFLFTGDAETKVEKSLLKEGLNLDCDVLKVGHHGSSTSSSEDFLNAVKPKYAAISVGAGNSYGHPHKEILASFNKRNTQTFRTDISGDITFFVRDGKITPQTEK